MKHYVDTEFIEGTQKKRFLGITYGKTPPTIDLISIGIVSEEGEEYYAISRDFNLKEAWNRFDLKKTSPAKKYMGFDTEKVYWIRYNVLRPIFWELIKKDEPLLENAEYKYNFTYRKLKKLIKKFGKSNKQIADEIFNFVNPDLGFHVSGYNNSELREGGRLYDHFDKHNVTLIDNRYVAQPEFYAYFADYDWTVFCWLFGKMIDLPLGFPKYCLDLKQTQDEIYQAKKIEYKSQEINNGKSFLNSLKDHPDYPRQSNEHNALDDAKFNKKLDEFLTSIKNEPIK